MGTRNQPGQYDCLARLADDEPYFVLVAHDDSAPGTIVAWVADRLDRIRLGERPGADLAQLREALNLARDMLAWQRERKRRHLVGRTLDFERASRALDEAAELLHCDAP
jgi:hypothetical protein